MADSLNTQTETILVVDQGGLGILATQAEALVIGIYPSETVENSSTLAMTVIEPTQNSEVAQFEALVVAQGRVDDKTVRVWAFSLDGHDFYCITLGSKSTLIYDTTTGTWSEWSSPGIPVWRAHKGHNWVSMDATTYESSLSNVVAGDDSLGILWTLDPTVGYDENITPEGEPIAYLRQVTGGVPGKARETVPVGAVYLTGSMARPQLEGANITLSTSDDNGNTWTEHETITVEASNYDQEFSWRSLGLIKAPGKLFRIQDTGASVRLDNLEMR